MRITKPLTSIIIIFSLLINIFIFAFTGSVSVSAKTKEKYNIVRIDKTKKFSTGITAKVYYYKVQLKGKSKAINKINKAINKDYNYFLKSAKNIYEYSQTTTAINNTTYKWIANSKVTYNKNNIISIRVTTYWFAGGVSNTNRYGLTFNTKTGKKLGVKSVCDYNAKNLRSVVENKLEEKYANGLFNDEISSFKEYTKNVNKYSFFINPDNKCIVCFAPYTVCPGGYYSCVTIKGRYK